MMRSMTSRRTVLLSTLALAGARAWAQPAGAPFPTRGWATSSPEEQGMSSEVLERLVEFGLFNDMDSLLVARHGRIVLDATYAPFRPGLRHRINSATKSVTSVLIAIALAEGRLDSLDRHVVDFFPGRSIANLDARKQVMTIRHLLDMTSGLQWTEPFDGLPESYVAMERSDDWQQYILDRPMATEPGTVFRYNSGNSHLLSAIVTRLTGQSALDYARERLFGPLGIADVAWRHDPQGISAGGAGLYLQPQDMAKLGYLFLRNGAWEGRQLVPAAWFEAVRRADVDMRVGWARTLRYGLQFWTVPERDAFLAVGYHNQLVIVVPRLDIVVTTTASARFPPLGGQPSRPRYWFGDLLGFVEAAVRSPAPLPADPAARASLERKLREIARETRGLIGGPSAVATAVSGKVWRLPDNLLNVRSVTFAFDGPAASYSFDLRRPLPDIAATRFGGPIGLDGFYRVGGGMPYGPTAARGAWQADGRTMVLETQTLGNDDMVRATHVFGERTVDIAFETADGLLQGTVQGQAEE